MTLVDDNFVPDTIQGNDNLVMYRNEVISIDLLDYIESLGTNEEIEELMLYRNNDHEDLEVINKSDYEDLLNDSDFVESVKALQSEIKLARDLGTEWHKSECERLINELLDIEV